MLNTNGKRWAQGTRRYGVPSGRIGVRDLGSQPGLGSADPAPPTVVVHKYCGKILRDRHDGGCIAALFCIVFHCRLTEGYQYESCLSVS